MRSLRYNFDLVSHLVRRDFTLSYRRSALGILWSLLLPLAQLLVLVFVFQSVVPLNIAAYPAFLFAALLPWTWFSSCLHAATGAFLNNRDLLKRPNFAPAVLVVVSVLSHLVSYLIAIPVLLGVLAWYGRVPTVALALFPVLLLIQGTLLVGFGLMIATLNVFYRDVQYLVTVGLMLLFYLTPVFYRPEGLDPSLQAVFLLNPVAVLVQAFRSIFFEGRFPALAHVGLAGVQSLAILAAGYAVYRRQQHDMMDVV